MVVAASPTSLATCACTLGSLITAVRKPGRLKPYWPQVMSTSRMDAVTSSTALMICTQVVAFMPPNTT